MEVITEWSENNTEVTKELEDNPCVLSIQKQRTKGKLKALQGKSRPAMEVSVVQNAVLHVNGCIS